MSRNSRRNRKPHTSPTLKGKCGYNSEVWQPWQSEFMNDRAALTNMQWILSLALNRFRWEGLPESCNARFLEMQLLQNGIATIAQKADDISKTWLSLQAAPTGNYDVYGEPLNWQAMGWNGSTPFPCTRENGIIIWENTSWQSPWQMLRKFAFKLSRYDRTEDVNLAMQFASVIFECPKDQEFQLVNTVKQIAGFEPVVLGVDGYSDEVKTKTITSGVSPIMTELATGKQNVWNELYRFLGINHLAFEKNERMIEEEATANNEPTAIKLMDELAARREGARKFNELSGLNVTVEFNDFQTVQKIAGTEITNSEGGANNE